ncbi:MAG: hypothetical protein Q8O30_08985 [Candidatus Omnitrophota bacterium]|nr:hypothetical protein [Candidatus Omnitrophota bacterium]
MECDISAGPKNGTLTSYPYNLDRKGSVSTSFKQISDPKGRSDIQLFNDIFDSANKYKNNLNYGPLVLGDSYNSNSYTRGILEDVGIINPPLPDGLFYPGWTKPVSLKKP